jgi:NADPH:quinone reductase-like Zn-dependent oxidoreductase
MQNYLERLRSWITSPKGIAITVSSIALITATRLYFTGGVCRADRDLTGKIVIITGGNTGIGKATVEELAKRNCTIIFGARDERKSE